MKPIKTSHTLRHSINWIRFLKTFKAPIRQDVVKLWRAKEPGQ